MQSNHSFLLDIAANADPRFAELLTGIANHFGLHGRLSPKQFNPVQVAASYQGRTVPDSLYDCIIDARPTPGIGVTTSSLDAGAGLNATLAELCEDIASAFLRASVRLNPKPRD
jgi:hypothetical protein